MKDNPEHWGAVIDGLQSIIPNISGAIAGGLIRYGIAIRDGEPKRRRLMEAIVCAIFAGCVTNVIDLIPALAGVAGVTWWPDNATSILAAPVGAFVGFIGVDKIRDAAVSALEKKAGINQNADK